MATVYVPFAEFAPDQALTHDPQGGLRGPTQTANNVVPVTAVNGAVSYGPLPQLSPYSNALNLQCQGAYSHFSITGQVYVFAGDATNLYELTLGSTNFSVVSSAAGSYNIAGDDFWSFCAFSDSIIATNINNPIQVYNIGSVSAFAELSTTAPTAKYAAVVRDFLMVGYTQDGVNGVRPQRVWWSAIGDPTSWPTPGTQTAIADQSDYNENPGEQGVITGIVPNVGQNDAVIFFERGIVAVNYVGSPEIFAFRSLNATKGTKAPKSLAYVNDVVYYYGEDGFYVFDGNQSTSIGVQRVDNFFLNAVNPIYMDRTVAVVDPTSKTIIWSYVGKDAPNSVPNHALIYNWVLDKWSSADFTAEYLFQASTFGYTLDQLTTVYGTVDNIPYPLDSPVWSFNQRVIGGFDSNHMMNYMNGPALTPLVSTPQFQIGDGDKIPTDQFAVLNGARPVVSGTATNPLISIGSRTTLYNNFLFDTPTAVDANGLSAHRVNARYFVAQMSTATNPVFSQLQGVEVTLQPAGMR